MVGSDPAFLHESDSTGIAPELARLVAIADGVLVLDLLERDPGKSFATALIGPGRRGTELHVVEDAALDEHLV